MINDVLPAFAKLPRRKEPEETDPLRLDDKALSLDGLQAIYRNPALSLAVRMRAMIAAIPFETPKLLATAIVEEGSFAELLDARLKRNAELKLLENKTINATVIEPKPTSQPTPQPPPSLPNSTMRLYSNRFRRRI
jgi:hypothetical protein